MANLTGNLKDSMTATFPREFDIPNAMTIQEIYDKLNVHATAFQMPFSVKGGIPGERVVFEKEPNLDVTIWLHVKMCIRDRRKRSLSKSRGQMIMPTITGMPSPSPARIRSPGTARPSCSGRRMTASLDGTILIRNMR